MVVRERRWRAVEATEEAEDRATYVISVLVPTTFLPAAEQHSPR
jgi:hypothetical protein